MAGPTEVDLTLLVCTFNRSRDLREMLETAMAQQTGGMFTYEVVVVDNNSTDDTRQVVEGMIAAGHANLRYVFEGRQGKSSALNTGLSYVRGWICTVADDDFILPPDWLGKIVHALRANPQVSFVGGKMLPLWQGPVPGWLGREHWSSVALADYGDEPFYADESHPVCLLAPSFRVDDMEAVGGYRLGLSVSGGLIGGVEDVELLQRLWKTGRRGLYLPELSFLHKVPASRLTKDYHRRWHTGHGRFYAELRDPHFESSAARLSDIPAHLYRQAARDAWSWVGCQLRGRSADAFMHETRIRFFLGFFRERRRQHRALGGRGFASELATFARAVITGRHRAGAVTRR